MTSSEPRCPACAARLSVWDLVKASVPNRVRCGECRARLRFDLNLVAVTAVALAAFVLVIWLARPLYASLAVLGVVNAAVIASGVGIGLWVLFELALAAYLLRFRRVYTRDD